MEGHTKICQHEGTEQIIDDFIYLLMLFVELVEPSSFDFSQPEHFLCNLDVDDPMNERNEVTWIKSMPKSTHQDRIELAHRLTFLSFVIISKILRVMYVLVDVAAQGPLHTHVPVVSFDFDAGIHIEFPHSIDLYLCEVILDDCSVLFLNVLRWIIGQSRSSHAGHSQTPSSYIFKLNVSNAKDTIQKFVQDVVLSEFKLSYSFNWEDRSNSVQKQAEDEDKQLLSNSWQGVGNVDIVSCSIEVVFEVDILVNGANQRSRQEVYIAEISNIIGLIDNSSVKLILTQFCWIFDAILIIVSHSNVVKQLHHKNASDIESVYSVGQIESSQLYE